MMILQTALLGGGASLVTALLAGTLLLCAMRRRIDSASLPRSTDDTQATFLLDGDHLVDATAPGHALLQRVGADGGELDRLTRYLAQRFPGFESAHNRVAQRRLVELVADDGASALTLQQEGPRLRMTLRDCESVSATTAVDRGSLVALEHELDTLRGVTGTMPFPSWRQKADGTITWINQAYLQAVEARIGGRMDQWPPPALFDLALSPPDGETSEETRRLRIAGAEQSDDGWHECHVAPVGDEYLVSATNVDAVIRAETSLREFVQTLSRTFAHLTVGLAVFGKDRRLAMFNPALGDLTGLPMDLLLARPTLVRFLDALRERNMMPEPKDYRSWRQQIAMLEEKSADGTYSETWHLAGERTYRVAGRPQPDGAMALLIEDVSAEIGLTRRFRTELETGQAVLDSLDDALAVFDSSGTMVMSNAAYDELWGSETREGTAQLGVEEASRIWTAATAPSPMWGDLRDFLRAFGDREEWSAEALLRDGRPLACRFTPLSGGNTAVRFTPLQKRRSRVMLPVEAQAEIQRRLGA